MKKGILTLFLAGIIFSCSMAEGVHATEADRVKNTQNALSVEDVAEVVGEMPKDTGYAPLKFIDVDWDKLDSTYDEAVDSVGSAVYNSQWDSYSSNYYYNLMNESEQAFWDKLDAMCLGYLTGNTTLTTTENTKDADGNPVVCYLTQYVIYSNLTSQQAENVLMIFKFSKPQYYFLDMYSGIMAIGGTTGRAVLTVYEDFRDGAKRAEETKKFKSVIDNWVGQINAQPTDLLKEKKAHDLICEKVVYDPGYGNKNIKQNKFNQVAYSVFCTDSTVCAGYSQAMQILCNAVGIDCMVVTSLEHEWNVVRLNNSWYYVDLTWDDSDGWKDFGYDYVYAYFNRSKDYYLNNMYDAGTPNAAQHVTESFWDRYLPSITHDSGAGIDQTNYGSIHTPTGTMETPVITISGKAVTISSLSGGAIYYTTDGSMPSVSSTKTKKYSGAFAIPESGSIKAIAVADGKWDSSVAESKVLIYKVKFNTMGGSTVAEVAAQSGSTISTPSNPKKAGYKFDGWYTSAACTQAYNFGNVIEGNITLYAKWVPIKYTVKFDANGGYIDKKSVKTKKKTVSFDKTYGSLPSAKRSSYVFNGWYTKKSGGSVITSSDKVKLTSNKTYYARWSKVKTKKASISSVKSSKAGIMTVKIKNISTATGYQIRYSDKSNMSSAKTTTAYSSAKEIQKLKKGKKYYVQVRMYQKESVSGKKYYGDWSSIKSVTVKK